MATPNPRHLSRHTKAERGAPLQSRWTTRRRFLAHVPEGGPPPPTPDLLVNGTLNPDATGDYYEDGTYNGQPTYRRDDSAFWIWVHPMFLIWYISTTKGAATNSWSIVGYGPVGTYGPNGTYTGTAVVTTP